MRGQTVRRRSGPAIPALVAQLALSGASSMACSTLDLHVATGYGGPPAFVLDGSCSFPHLHVAASPDELYRAGDASGSDSATLTLYATKGSGPDEVWLHANAPCTTRPVTFADTGAALRELHVSTTGTAGGDGSPGAPFDLVRRAAAVARPGDRIVVHEGSYPGSEFVSDLHGTAANPIWISGASGEARPVLGSSGVAEAVHLSDSSFIVLQDLVVDGPTGNGINIDDGGDYATPAHDVVIQRIAIRNVGAGGNQDCLKLSGLDDFFVFDSDIRLCGDGGSGIDMVGCHRGLIEGNDFRETGANAIQAKGASSEVTIRGNLMVDAGARAMNLGGSTGLAHFRPLGALHEARDLRALSNVVIGFEAPVAYVGCDGCLVANNTFYRPGKWVMRILQETTEPGFIECRDGRFINNIVVFESALVRIFVNIGPSTLPDTFVYMNNLWYSLDDPSFSGPSLPTAETDAIIQEDPLLADPAAEDFHVAPGSPALAAGRCIDELVYDRDQICYADPPAVGAYEQP